MGLWECRAWEYGNMDTCASVTWSLGNNLTQSIREKRYLEMEYLKHGNYRDL